MCDHVIVMDKGRVATQGPIEELKGPAGACSNCASRATCRRSSTSLHDAGIECHGDRRGRHARVRAGRRWHRTRDRSSALAARTGVQVRHLRPSVPTLEDVFARAVGDGVDRCPSTIRATAATPARERAPRAARWSVIAAAGIMSLLRRSARSSALLLFAWIPFIIRAVQIYVAANFPQAAMLAPTPETFREFLESAELLRLLRDDLRRRRPDRQRPPRQRAADYLSKPLTRAEYVAGKLAILLDVPAAGHVGAGDAAALLQITVRRRASRSCARTSFLFPAITVCVADPGAGRLVRDAGAVVALEEQPLRRRSSMPGIDASSRAPCSASCGSSPAATSVSWVSFTASLEQVGDVIFRLHAALRHAAGWSSCCSLVVARRSDRRSRVSVLEAARARRGGGRRERRADRHRRAALEVVRPGDRAQRRHRDGAAGHHRACSARTAPASRRS